MNPNINLHHKLRVSEFGYNGNKKTGSQKISELVNEFLGVGKAWINSKVCFFNFKNLRLLTQAAIHAEEKDNIFIQTLG